MQVDGLSLLTASISYWLRKALRDVPHVLVATNFHSVVQLSLLPSSALLSLLVLRNFESDKKKPSVKFKNGKLKCFRKMFRTETSKWPIR